MRSSWILHHFLLRNCTVLLDFITLHIARGTRRASCRGPARLRRHPLIKTWARVCVCNASHVHFAGLHSVDSCKQSSSIKALLYRAWHLDGTRPRLSVSVSTDFSCVSAAFFSCLRLETRRRVAVLRGSLGSSHADCPITVTDGGPRVATLLSFPAPFLSTYAIWQRYDRTFWGDFAPSHPPATLKWCVELDMTAVYSGGVFLIWQSHWLRARLRKWFKGFWIADYCI